MFFKKTLDKWFSLKKNTSIKNILNKNTVKHLKLKVFQIETLYENWIERIVIIENICDTNFTKRGSFCDANFLKLKLKNKRRKHKLLQMSFVQ